MTDGIIQEVFKKYIKQYRAFEDSGVCDNIIKLQQELIENIRQDFKEYDIDIIRMLIGDNNE